LDGDLKAGWALADEKTTGQPVARGRHDSPGMLGMPRGRVKTIQYTTQSVRVATRSTLKPGFIHAEERGLGRV